MRLVIRPRLKSRGVLAIALIAATAAVLAPSVIDVPTAAADPVPSCDATGCTVVFTPAGTSQDWTVPAGVSSVTVTMAAGSGGGSLQAEGVGGAGGEMIATVPVQWLETLVVLTGTAGTTTSGGYGGGGNPGPDIGGTGGGGGGGSFVFEMNPTSTVLLAVGGGGGAGSGFGEVAGVGGSDGPGTDATSIAPDPGIAGLGGTLDGGGAGGPGDQGPPSNGLSGSGPAAPPQNAGLGGAGGETEFLGGVSSGGGGGGGYYGGGGGGDEDPLGTYSGSGGGGSGYNAPGTTVDSTSTNTGDGSVTITYAPVVNTTTSGVLLNATTGNPIPNSCVAYSPVADPGQDNFTSVGANGQWSFTTAEFGPFDLAFYTTSNGDCSQPILPTPVPSWFENQALTGTDAGTITPPNGASSVAAGTSDTVACLGESALPTTCAPAEVELSGTVYTTDLTPVPNTCVFVVDSTGNADAFALTDGNGNWSVSGLPSSFNVVVVFIPYFSGQGGPCMGNGGPPVPGAGQNQPVIYNNIWANLADPSLLNDPYSWAVAHGATVLTAPAANIDACLTSAAGSVVPRPSCSPPTTTAAVSNDGTLAFTGATLQPLIFGGAVLLLGGFTVLLFIRPRRGRHRRPA